MGERYGIDGLKWRGKCFIIKKNELDLSICFRNLRNYNAAIAARR